LNDLKSQYKIEYFSANFDAREKAIETIDKSSNITIDVIYEKFIRLTILEPNLKTYLMTYISFFHHHDTNNDDDSIYKIQLPTIVNNLAKRNARFIERDDNVIYKMGQLLESHKCLCVYGEMGIGKQELAIEFGWRVHADYCVRVFHFDTIESDFRQFAQILGAQVNANSTTDLDENVAFRLRKLNNRKFLFIILNVLDFKDIEVYVNRFISLTNVKLLLTTPHEKKLLNTHYIDNDQIELNWFSLNEANEYLRRFYERSPQLDKSQKRKLFELGGWVSSDG
jgi:hypothetical protein